MNCHPLPGDAATPMRRHPKNHCNSPVRAAAAPLALALSAACLTAAMPAHAQDANAPVPIGMVLSKQGNFADVGTSGARGAMIAIDEAGGKVLGRPIKLTWYDDPDPQTAQQNMSKLIDSEKVVAVVGGTNSASSLGEAAVAKHSKIPTVIFTGSAKEITGKDCNRYTFRTYYSANIASRAIVAPMMSHGKRWYFLTPNYAAGADAYAAMKTELLKRGGQEIENDRIPVGSSDYSSVILKIRDAKPDVVALSLTGLDTDNFLKQWAQYGMKDKIPLADPFMNDTSLWSLAPENVTGTYATIWQYADPQNSEPEKRMVAAYRKKYGSPPSINVWEGWTSMRVIIDAINAAKSTEPAAIVHQLETLKWTDREPAAYYRAWDHQYIHPLLIVQGHPPKTEKWDVLSVVQRVPGKGDDIEQLFGDKTEVGCHMDEL
ncbi:MAG: ABC transporter substrate-binding protein [Janthinobacterium lividum]